MEVNGRTIKELWHVPTGSLLSGGKPKPLNSSIFQQRFKYVDYDNNNSLESIYIVPQEKLPSASDYLAKEIIEFDGKLFGFVLNTNFVLDFYNMETGTKIKSVTLSVASTGRHSDYPPSIISFNSYLIVITGSVTADTANVFRYVNNDFIYNNKLSISGNWVAKDIMKNDKIVYVVDSRDNYFCIFNNDLTVINKIPYKWLYDGIFVASSFDRVVVADTLYDKIKEYDMSGSPIKQTSKSMDDSYGVKWIEDSIHYSSIGGKIYSWDKNDTYRMVLKSFDLTNYVFENIKEFYDSSGILDSSGSYDSSNNIVVEKKPLVYFYNDRYLLLKILNKTASYNAALSSLRVKAKYIDLLNLSTGLNDYYDEFYISNYYESSDYSGVFINKNNFNKYSISKIGKSYFLIAKINKKYFDNLGG